MKAWLRARAATFAVRDQERWSSQRWESAGGSGPVVSDAALASSQLPFEGGGRASSDPLLSVLQIFPPPCREGVRDRNSIRTFPSECVGRVGAGFLLSHPPAMALAHPAVEALSTLTHASEWGFVVGLTGLLYLWVVDLPASERFHHARRFGLIEHSLEVASSAIANLVRRRRTSIGRDALTPGEQTLWSRVLFALGLFHDVGKAWDVKVQGGRENAVWNPDEEPLAFFRERNGMVMATPTPFRHKRGRGLRGHEALGLAILGRLALEPVGVAVRPFLEAAFRVYHQRDSASIKAFPMPLRYLVGLLMEADRYSTLEDRSARFPRILAPKAESGRKRAGHD